VGIFVGHSFVVNMPYIKWRRDILVYLSVKYPELMSELKPWEILSLLAHNWPGNVREIERIKGMADRNVA